MDYSSEEETDISDSELEEYSETCYQELSDGKFQVKFDKEVYRCPYCCKKKKQHYGFKDLLQHASSIGMGSGSKRTIKEKGKHMGLVKYMENLEKMKLPETFSPEDATHSENSNRNEMLVYPWAGIVANIPVELSGGRYIGGSGSKLRNEFAAKGFNPIRVTPLWNRRGHSRFAAVEFGKDWPAFHCALQFEKCFEAAGKGKRDYYNDVDHVGSELYGWMAREDDYNLKNVVGDFLKRYGDLKTVNDVEADEKNKDKMLLSNLSNVIEVKNMHLKEIEAKYSETSIALGNLITEKDKMHQAYNEELQKMQQNEHVQLQKILNGQAKMKFELQQREKELQKREAHNESERKKLALEKQMHERATLEQKRADEDVLKLAEDHKRNREELHKRAMELEKQLNAKQGLELEIERMRGSLSVMKHMEGDGDSEFMQKIGDTEMALRQKEEELEELEALNQALVVMERKSNDELQDARKELITFFKSRKSGIGVKGMGELDYKPFHAVCRRKYTRSEAGEKAAKLCSLWEEQLRDPSWHPFKIVAVKGTEGHKEIIDEEDEKLKRLKVEWGNEVQMAVCAALVEMNEYNPSGRYIIQELWNYEAGRKATLSEGVSQLLDLRTRKRNR